MSNLGKKLNEFSSNKPLIWYRYVDDILCIFNTKQDINNALTSINRWHKNIKFTIEKEKEKKINFLGVLIIRNEKTKEYDITIYKKPTSTDLYLLYDGNQSKTYKLSLIRSLTIRILLICSTVEYSQLETRELKKVLTQNRYQNNIIKKGIKEGEIITKRIKNNENKKIKNSTKKNKIYLTIACYNEESVILSQKIEKLGKNFLPNIDIIVAFKKTNTIKSMFLPIQKGTEEEKANKKLVYNIQCKNRDYSYCEETNRELSTRLKEHQEDTRKQKDTSKIAEHMYKNKHTMDFENAEILCYEFDW